MNINNKIDLLYIKILNQINNKHYINNIKLIN